MNVQLRPLALTDLDFAHGLSRLAGWNQTRRDWQRFVQLAPSGCFLATCEERAAGTATTTAYGRELGWIGMVLVHPDFRRRGIGTALLRRAIEHLRHEREVACVRLDATPEGRPLYEGLGFRAEWGLRRWVREGSVSEGPERASSVILTARPQSLPEISFALDRQVFGADRRELLQSLLQGSLFGQVLEDGSYGLGREGERALYVGPVVAASAPSGETLVRSLLASLPLDRAVFWDLPDENGAAVELASSLGFRPARVLTRMWLGDAPSPAEPGRLWGLAEPGLG